MLAAMVQQCLSGYAAHRALYQRLLLLANVRSVTLDAISWQQHVARLREPLVVRASGRLALLEPQSGGAIRTET